MPASVGAVVTTAGAAAVPPAPATPTAGAGTAAPPLVELELSLGVGTSLEFLPAPPLAREICKATKLLLSFTRVTADS